MLGWSRWKDRLSALFTGFLPKSRDSLKAAASLLCVCVCQRRKTAAHHLHLLLCCVKLSFFLKEEEYNLLGLNLFVFKHMLLNTVCSLQVQIRATCSHHLAVPNTTHTFYNVFHSLLQEQPLF